MKDNSMERPSNKIRKDLLDILNGGLLQEAQAISETLKNSPAPASPIRRPPCMTIRLIAAERALLAKNGDSSKE